MSIFKSHLDEGKCDLLECIVWIYMSVSGKFLKFGLLDFNHKQVSKAYNFR